MATLKDFKIARSWNKRYGDEYNIAFVGVDVGRNYDKVDFSINEVRGYYWRISLGFPCRTPKAKIESFLKEFVKEQITQEEIDGYNSFLRDVNTWGD